jgi:hypothetical protein
MEWNDSAIALIFAIFLIPVILVYFFLRKIIKTFPRLKTFIQKQKEERLLIYIGIEIVLFILAVVLTITILSLIKYLRGGRGLFQS